MKIDFHTHTNRYSICSALDPRDLFETALDRDLDGLVVTEHNRFWEPGEIKPFREEFQELTIFTGAEIEVESLHHVIALLPSPDQSICELEDPGSLVRAIRERGGYAIAAHPYRYFEDFEVRNRKFQLDGVEIASRKMRTVEEERQSRQLADLWESNLFANSDAHSEAPIGEFLTEIDARPENEGELIRALREQKTDPRISGSRDPNVDVH